MKAAASVMVMVGGLFAAFAAVSEALAGLVRPSPPGLDVEAVIEWAVLAITITAGLLGIVMSVTKSWIPSVLVMVISIPAFIAGSIPVRIFVVLTLMGALLGFIAALLLASRDSQAEAEQQPESD